MVSTVNKINELSTVRKLFTVNQFSQKHQAFSPSSIRHLIFDAEKNGFSRVIKRIGKRRVLIDEFEFFQWVDLQQGGEK